MLTGFYNWLIGNMGTPGDYAYQSIHIWSTVVVMAILGLVIFLGLRYRTNEIARRRLLLVVAWFHLGFEVLWRLIYFFVKGAALKELWPMYPCNLGSVLLPILAIWNIRRGKQLFYLFGFVGSVLTMAIPDGIFSTNVLVFPVLKSILQHTGLLMIPVLELIYGTYRPTLKDMGWVIGGCVVHLINCEGIDRLLGFTGDYMFLRSGMPFVIPGVPTWITLPVFALLVFTLLSFLCDIKGSTAFLKRSKTQV